MNSTCRELATLECSVDMNMQLLKEGHDEEKSSSKENCTSETIEEIEKLCQNLENKEGYVM